jgi:primosomal protein N' (replication factor Y)
VILELVPVPSVAETKSVISLLDPLPVLNSTQIALARWMAAYYLSPLAAMIDLMLPAGLAQQADVLYQTVDGRPWTEDNPSSTVHSRLLALLAERGPLRGRQIDRHFKNVDWRKSAQYLVRRGVLTSQSVLPPITVRPKFVRTAQLALPPDQVEAALPGLGKTKATQARREAALRFLIREPDAVNVSWIYAESGCNLADLEELDERGLIVLRETEIWRDPLERVESEGTAGDLPVDLTPAQQNIWKTISESFNYQPSTFLLHGVTGSGKTELYIRASAEAIRRGRGAIILVPEIALTPQTVHRFLARFPGQVGILHSRLSDGERYDTWRRARLGLLKVVIGPRSALFAPISNAGLIVVDECHDGSYYQSEPPFYNAATAAEEYARLCGAVCILGSATPTIVQRYQASPPPDISPIEGRDGMRVLELPHRIINAEMPPVQIVDMREELKSGNRNIFSQLLVNALDDVLKKGQQAILFLNRRGTATYVFCRECGHVMKCPNCDTPLTHHIENQGSDLRCHRCNYTRRLPRTCPTCGSTQIRAYGLGSERVEAEVKRLFPSVRTLRWDWETTRHKDSHALILSHFTAHRADVLIGTQMLAKGLDLPLVTLVGIVLADVGLNLPDPFAPERTFNLLTQVAGRAGRSSLGGRVVLQTFQPESYVIQAASKHDYADFYGQEIKLRRALGYPPFSRLIRLEYRALDPVKVEAEMKRVAEMLQKQLDTGKYRLTSLIGPVPCFFAKLGGWHRWQIILRGPEPRMLMEGMKLDGWRVEVDPVSLL